MLLDNYCDDFCVCQRCGKVIPHQECHRNDTEVNGRSLCYSCEAMEKQKIEPKKKMRNDIPIWLTETID